MPAQVQSFLTASYSTKNAQSFAETTQDCYFRSMFQVNQFYPNEISGWQIRYPLVYAFTHRLLPCSVSVLPFNECHEIQTSKEVIEKIYYLFPLTSRDDGGSKYSLKRCI